MRLNVFVLACAALAVAGCVSVTPPDVDRAFFKYQLVDMSMTRAEVIALVGKPQVTDKNGTLHWRTTTDDEWLTAELNISFGCDDHIAQLSRRKYPIPAARARWIEPGEGMTPPPRKDHEGTSGAPLSDHDVPPLR